MSEIPCLICVLVTMRACDGILAYCQVLIIDRSWKWSHILICCKASQTCLLSSAPFRSEHMEEWRSHFSVMSEAARQSFLAHLGLPLAQGILTVRIVPAPSS